ncbi:hypothetical protein GCM10020000_08230 [Streptomyces olivoverticillatus]
MRIQIITAGTTGSVAPYTGLGHRLRDEGHDVEIVTHAKFADVVTCCGLRMRPLGADPFEELLGAHERLRAPGRSPGAALEFVRATRRAAVALADGLLSAVDPKADLLLLSSLVAPLGRVVAQYHGLPSMGGPSCSPTPRRPHSRRAPRPGSPRGRPTGFAGTPPMPSSTPCTGPRTARCTPGSASPSAAATGSARTGSAAGGPSGTATAPSCCRARPTGAPGCGSRATGGRTSARTGSRPRW